MLRLLARQAVSHVSRRTKVTRPDSPRFKVGATHISDSVNPFSVTDLVIGFTTFAVFTFGPAIYMVKAWQKYRPAE